MTGAGLLLAIVLAVVVIAGFGTAYVTQDMNRRGLNGPLFALLVWLLPGAGLVAYLIVRSRSPIEDHTVDPPGARILRRIAKSG